ncbi:hypothetical protein ACWIDW_04980 [Microbacterium sp. NPDC055312]
MTTNKTAQINAIVQQVWASESPLGFTRELLVALLEEVETAGEKMSVMFLLEGLAGELADQLGEESSLQLLARTERKLRKAKSRAKKAEERSARAAGERFRKLLLIDETGGDADFKKFWSEAPERLVEEFLAGFKDDSEALTADLRCSAADHLRRAADHAVMYWGDREIHGSIEV